MNLTAGHLRTLEKSKQNITKATAEHITAHRDRLVIIKVDPQNHARTRKMEDLRRKELFRHRSYEDKTKCKKKLHPRQSWSETDIFSSQSFTRCVATDNKKKIKRISFRTEALFVHMVYVSQRTWWEEGRTKARAGGRIDRRGREEVADTNTKGKATEWILLVDEKSGGEGIERLDKWKGRIIKILKATIVDGKTNGVRPLFWLWQRMRACLSPSVCVCACAEYIVTVLVRLCGDRRQSAWCGCYFRQHVA